MLTYLLYLHFNLTSTSAISGTLPCKGNGLTLGLTDGTNNLGLSGGRSDNWYVGIAPSYNIAAGTTYTSASPQQAAKKTTGVTTDASKSGIVAVLSSATIGEIPSLQLGNFYIRY